MHRSESGQVLVIVALALVVLLGASAFTIDLGRRAAEERFLQNAADAAALAACNALIDGATESAALAKAQAVAATNLAGSPAGSDGALAAPGAEEYLDGHHGNPIQLTNGVLIDGSDVRVAIDSTLDTTVGAVLGRNTLGAVGRSRCTLEAEPAIPIVARRYENPPGPGSGFVDHVATEATSTTGAVDATDPRGYDGLNRQPASELAPGPEFEIFGPDSKASNDSAFRGFIALDIRDFTDDTSRKYYTETTETTTANELKVQHQWYLVHGYPGPGLPAVTSPASGGTQVGVMVGVNAGHVTQPFRERYGEGDRILLAVYDGTVMKVPDFSIQPPIEIALPATTSAPEDGPTFKVTRNDAFSSLVSFRLFGDEGADAAGHPEYDILPDPSVTPPDTGTMDEPTFSPDSFVPAGGNHGTDVEMLDISTNDVPEGIYAVWLEGHAGAPYYQERRQPVSVRIGDVARAFDLDGSVLDGATETLGGTITLPIEVRTGSGSSAWDAGGGVATAVDLSYDAGSLSDCSHNPVSIGMGSLTFSPASVTPTTAGAASTLTIQTTGLAEGCYLATIRAQGVNDDGQPVVRLEQVRFTVAATSGPDEYVDILGYAVFEVTVADSNRISGRAITGVYANPDDWALRTAQQARLIPWN